MTRRQWMWLWIWLLLFFIIFCVWNKVQTLTDNSKEAVTKTIPTVVNKTPKPEPETDSKNDESKDINFKLIKDDNKIKISGIFSSKEDLDAVKSKFENGSNMIEEGVIIIDEKAKNSKISNLLVDISDDFSKFKNGYLEYSDKKIIIDGIVDDISIKESIGEKALLAQDLFVLNRTTVEKEPEEEEIKEEVSKKISKDEIQQELNDLLKVKKVEFVFAKATLTESGKKTVDEVYELLKKYGDINIEIGGHTDSSGTAKRNKILSQKRANAIKRYLISKGIDSNRLKAVGYGESRPLVKNNSSKNRQINRRVEFKIIGE